MTNTLSVTQMIFPESGGSPGGMLPYMALIMPDVGAVAWLFVFLRYSEGIMQRAIAVRVVHQPGWSIFLSVAISTWRSDPDLPSF
ncbi:hypothetical protein [Candidatus Amarobacter glycogenicus]|uniref:hypothetical protein n=1 Tax=Candidatus Amarobacter glycogenicus TaxID=3140699 RepID=UPI002A0E969B|nr:hypothetical protein [Dehalococcoidia bacterium]